MGGSLIPKMEAVVPATTGLVAATGVDGLIPSAVAESVNAPEEELPPLEAAEVKTRLARSARQFRNRRKVLIRGLPSDVANQVTRRGVACVRGGWESYIRQ